MINSVLDGEQLTPSETLILLWFHTIGAGHVKVHAIANWGVNVEQEQQKNNPFHAQNSLVTVMYNYFGYTVFGDFMEFWKFVGLLDINFRHSLVTFDICKALNHSTCIY